MTEAKIDIDKKIKKRTLAKLFVVSAIVFYSASLFGPWEWHVYSVEGLVYFAAVEVLFLLGLVSGVVVSKRAISKEEPEKASLSKGQKKFLIAISVISVLCWLYEMFQLLVVNAGSFVFMAGAGQAEEYLEGRSVVDQIALVAMQLGAGSYIMCHLFARDMTRFERLVVGLGLWSTSIYLLTYGQRFNLAVTFIIFVAVWRLKSGTFADLRRRMKQSKFLRYAAITLIGIVILAAFLYVFDTRLHTEALYKYEFVPGDMALKPFWYELYFATGGAIDPILMLADYMGEAPYIFSGVWAFGLSDQTYWLYQFVRPFIQLGSIFGLPSYTDIVAQIAGPAKYSGLAFDLINNFSIYLAPIASFLIGFAFSEIERLRFHFPLCAALYPCCIAATLFAPVYFINVGRLDYVVYGIIFLYILMGCVKAHRS